VALLVTTVGLGLSGSTCSVNVLASFRFIQPDKEIIAAAIKTKSGVFMIYLFIDLLRFFDVLFILIF